MKNHNWFKGLCLYQRSIVVILCLSLLSVGSVSVAAMVNHMDIPTLIASWSTKQVSVNQLRQRQLKPVILIDVRSPEEYAEDRIGESPLVPIIDIEMGFGVKQIQSIVKARVKSERTQPVIVLYCARGGRSVKAYKQLEKIARYSQESGGNETNKIKDISLNVVVLSGGITAWRQAVPVPKDAQILAPITLHSFIKSPSVTLLSE